MTEPTPVPVLHIAVLTDDDSVITMLGGRAFGDLLRAASLAVIVVTTPSQARDLGNMPLVVTADCAHWAIALALDTNRRVTGVCDALAYGAPRKADNVRWLPWPPSPDAWIELLALAAVQSSFATTSQMLARRASDTSR